MYEHNATVYGLSASFMLACVVVRRNVTYILLLSYKQENVGWWVAGC